MQLRTARIFVRDLPGASRFYEELLGLQLKSPRSEEGFRVFDAGPMSLVVERVDADAPAEDQALIGRFTGLSFDVADVQSKYSELASLGVAFSGLPEQQAWGGILATLRDPSGNELQLVQQPLR
ncbi:VOC family protein [Variovorax paradoxus]|uniref:Glyoxalase/bleomycin resistance/dioxygenase family protein n=1 Tax=Variovorax paradoxus TaxID=34073 RepID=A0A6I6HLG6_VARPD|nr:VOC family protein [Variovorax paradoxus]QGW83771.1 glyoxalase/bleomycin resistance/dioxygenase family protein [Variovorax paradoxus]